MGQVILSHYLSLPLLTTSRESVIILNTTDRSISTARTCRAISSGFTIPAGTCSGSTNTIRGATFFRKPARKS